MKNIILSKLCFCCHMFNYASLNLKTDLYLFRDHVHVHDPGYCYGYLCFHFAVALHSCFDSLTGFFHVVSCSFLCKGKNKSKLFRQFLERL